MTEVDSIAYSIAYARARMNVAKNSVLTLEPHHRTCVPLCVYPLGTGDGQVKVFWHWWLPKCFLKRAYFGGVETCFPLFSKYFNLGSLNQALSLLVMMEQYNLMSSYKSKPSFSLVKGKPEGNERQFVENYLKTDEQLNCFVRTWSHFQ